jgi:hypothetical protein
LPSMLLGPNLQQISGWPILRVFCEEWDKQISMRNRLRQAAYEACWGELASDHQH